MANAPGGNNPTGRNQYSGPRTGVGGSMLQYSLDVRGMREFVQSKIGQAKGVQPAIRKANIELAQGLQEAQQGVLIAAIIKRGRPQYRGDKLVNAIISPKNRSVNVDGFTVGRLDEFPVVKSYWRGLEYGTSRHVGRFLPGYFIDGNGQPLPFVEGGRDVFKVRSGSKMKDPKRNGLRGGKSPFRARIRNAIDPINFQTKGYQEWRKEQGANQEVIATYARYLKKAGIEFGLGPGNIARTSTGTRNGPLGGRAQRSSGDTISGRPIRGRYSGQARDR